MEDVCAICHEDFKGDDNTIECANKHSIHYNCYTEWKKQQNQRNGVKCVICREAEYIDKIKKYIDLFIAIARFEEIDYLKDILDNKLKAAAHEDLFNECLGSRMSPFVIQFFLENGYVVWDTAKYGNALEKCLFAGRGPLLSDESSQQLLTLLRGCGLDVEAPLGDGLPLIQRGLKSKWLLNYLIKECFLDVEQAYCRPGDPSALLSLVMQGKWDEAGVLVLSVDYDKIDYQDRDGWTALHYAAREGNDRLVATLCNRGASMAVLDNNGFNPLDTAYYYWKDCCMRTMERYGGRRTEAAKRGPNLQPVRNNQHRLPQGVDANGRLLVGAMEEHVARQEELRNILQHMVELREQDDDELH